MRPYKIVVAGISEYATITILHGDYNQLQTYIP